MRRSTVTENQYRLKYVDRVQHLTTRNTNENLRMAQTTVAARDNTHFGADFETAIDATGFGWYNILLLLAALWCAMGTIFETSTVSFILQSAECDLNLTLIDKGTLNAITYAGMISSALFWGFISDTKGRKKILVYAQLIDFICVLGSAMSQNVTTLMIFKYFGGCMASGTFAVIVTYLTEMHGIQYRGRVVMTMGIMFSTSSILLPTLAIAILPNTWDFQLLGLNFHSWQIFLAISAIPTLIGGCLLSFYPESPKFLMTQGRNKEALEVFRTMYTMNKLKPRDEYPIKRLEFEISRDDETTTETAPGGIENGPNSNSKKIKSTLTRLRDGLKQWRPLFHKPYLSLALRVYLLNFCLLTGKNTMRLWLPQLFASIEEYSQKHQGASSLCTILEYSVNKTVNSYDYTNSEICDVVVNVDSYVNNIIVAAAGFCSYIIAGLLINLVGAKWISTASLAIAGTAGIALYWSISELTTLIISGIFVTVGNLSSTALTGATANLFPTSLRTMVVSCSMMIGRSGSLIGNILFAVFMSMGCIPPLIMLSFVMFFACILAAFLPNTKKTQLK